MIDDAALELVALSEFSRSDHEDEEEDGEQGGDDNEGDDEWNGRNICFLRSHLGHWWVASVRVVPPVLPTISNVPVLRLPIKTCKKYPFSAVSRIQYPLNLLPPGCRSLMSIAAKGCSKWPLDPEP